MSNKNFLIVAAALVMAFTAPSVRADVTIRYLTTFKTAAPPMAAASSITLPDMSHTIRMKGNHGALTDQNTTTLMDFARQEITVIDAASRKYATIPAAQYAARTAGAVPRLDSGPNGPKTSHLESPMTGRTETIQGVPAAEREITTAIETPMPPGLPQSSLSLRLVIRIWTARPEAVLRIPAVRELSGFQRWQTYFMNPVDVVKELAPGNAATSLAEELANDPSLMLRMDMEMYLPSLAALAPSLQDSTEAASPFMRMRSEVTDLSTAAIDDSVFQIPADFQAAPFGEVMNSSLQERSRAATASLHMPAAANPPAAGSGPRQRFYRLGDLAQAAWRAGDAGQTEAYAQEMLRAAARYPNDWNYGNAIHDGHMYLGLLAAREGDAAKAREQLLEAGRTTGSPQLNSFGPNMALALELLRQGQRDAVLDYFQLCRSFWKMGGRQLDQWSEIVRTGGTPVFGTNLR